MFPRQVALRIVETSQSGDARRVAARMGEKLGLEEPDRGRLALIVTEVARNLALHAREGELLLRCADNRFWHGVEVLAIDKGPGMASLAECLRDGYSTRGTPGTGLGAIRRTADFFDIYSQPEQGTVVLARVDARHSRPRRSMALGVISLPVAGEEVSGDAWWVKQVGGRNVILVVDGLGHGEIAAEAAGAAVRLFSSTENNQTPKSTMESLHAGLRSTRGAAAAVAEIDMAAAELRYLGIGNISGYILAPTFSKGLIGHNGTLGHEVRKLQEFTYKFPPGATLVMYSDGLATWSLDRYPGVLAKHPSILAALLYRDFKRSRDDVTVLVARDLQGQQ